MPALVIFYQGRRSSASWRVRWGLALKDVPYTASFVDIASGAHHHALDGVSPLHQVPALVLDDGTVLVESVAILEWLEETIPTPPLLPREPLLRAQVRALVQVVNSGIQPLQNTIVRKAISFETDVQDAWSVRWVVRGLAAYEALVQRHAGRFSVGDEITMADLYLVPQVRNAIRFGIDLAAYPRVAAIYAAAVETPAAQASAPETVGDAPL